MPAPLRLPDDTHPVSVRLQVSDLARSRQWYTSTLGCRVIGVTDGEGKELEVRIRSGEMRSAEIGKCQKP